MTKVKSQFACDPRLIRVLRTRQNYKLARRELYNYPQSLVSQYITFYHDMIALPGE